MQRENGAKTVAMEMETLRYEPSCAFLSLNRGAKCQLSQLNLSRDILDFVTYLNSVTTCDAIDFLFA